MSYTPGPWEWFGNSIKSVYGKYGMDDSELLPVARLGSGKNLEANARLISASPEMYEALEAAFHAVSMGWDAREVLGENSPILEAARAALAKARLNVGLLPTRSRIRRAPPSVA